MTEDASEREPELEEHPPPARTQGATISRRRLI